MSGLQSQVRAKQTRRWSQGIESIDEIFDSPKWLPSQQDRGLSGDFETTVCAPILVFRGPFDWISDHGYNPVE